MVPATVATGMDPVAIVCGVPEDQLISEPDGGSAWMVAVFMTPCLRPNLDCSHTENRETATTKTDSNLNEAGLSRPRPSS